MSAAGALLVAGVLLAAAPVSAQEATPMVDLGPLTARLYYKLSGTLSADLLARKEPFSGWNTVIGEGDAEEPAEDLLVAVTLGSTNEEEALLDDTLALWVTDAKGKEIARRDFEGVLVPYRGTVSSPLWLSDVGCAGKLVLHARLGRQTRRAELNLDCGE